jgi:transposase
VLIVESKKLVEDARCGLMFLSPYLLDLNPIEKYRFNMKVKVREVLLKDKKFNYVLN